MKQVTKFLYVMGLVFLLVGCSSGIKVSMKEHIELEYGDDIDDNSLYDKSQSDEDITVKEVVGYDKLTLGEQEITVIFTNESNKIKEEAIKVIVNDTRKPEITLKKETVTIVQGDKLDLKANIALVKDPIDGNINISDDRKLTRNGYFIEDNVDSTKPGSYTVTIIAYDKNGNKAEKSYTVNVKQKQAEQQRNTVQANSQASSYTASGSSQSTSGSYQTSTATGTTSSSQTTSQQKAPVNNTPAITNKVYIAGSGNGTKYHSHPNCSNMKNPVPISIDDAKASGYTACKKCY